MELLEKLKLILKETNPWWKGTAFQLEDYFPREVFAEIEKFSKLRQIIALVGLRRTGKTTLLLKVIETYLKQIHAKNILYLSFDDLLNVNIEDVLQAYQEIFQDLDLKKGNFLFCLDEIQKLPDWQEKVKRLYDTYRNIKIVISGSESLFLRKKMKETLSGRIFEFKISQLSFKEYLVFTNNEPKIENIELYKEELIKLYRHFLKISGFPELVRIDDDRVIHKYLKESIIDKILFRDIPQLFRVRNVEVVGEILDIILFSPGQIIDIIKLSKELGLTRQVVSSYLDYLEKSFLIKKIYNFSKNLRKQKRALKKYYPAVIFPVVIEEKFPLCFESSLIWQLGAQFFYRDAYQNEVDAVMIDKDRNPIPIEIKTGRFDLNGIKSFTRRYQVREAIVLTLTQEERRERIKIVPFYKYLLK